MTKFIIAALMLTSVSHLAVAQTTTPTLGELKEPDVPCLAPAEDDEKGWGKPQYFWQKEIVTFNFLSGEGTERLKDRVADLATQWNGIAKITLQRVSDSERADIRVGFGPYGHWSKIGNTAKRVPTSKRTMNLQVKDSTNGTELRRVTLHEFGHALGLMHEHQHPEAPIQWKEEAVLLYYSGEPNNWNEAQIRANILSHYSGAGTVSVGFDPKSIMLYPIARGLTYNFTARRNTALSEKDREFLRAAYH